MSLSLIQSPIPSQKEVLGSTPANSTLKPFIRTSVYGPVHVLVNVIDLLLKSCCLPDTICTLNHHLFSFYLRNIQKLNIARSQGRVQKSEVEEPTDRINATSKQTQRILVLIDITFFSFFLQTLGATHNRKLITVKSWILLLHPFSRAHLPFMLLLPVHLSTLLHLLWWCSQSNWSRDSWIPKMAETF